ncbi:MAG TPA: tryptophan synthase subunit alpha [Candidatus Glassbacteria bacterium]|nr:tryptophan synthase subunit alpha [Candidatus Glassbacteria bacterium]
MENKIDRRLAELQKAGRHGLMAHIVVGYPDLNKSERILLALAEAGADLVELQIPFTDPLADGPTILKANLASLAAGTRVADCLKFAEKMAGKLGKLPLLFMTYVNIPFSYGLAKFCRDASAAGISGLIVPDIPPDEPAESYHELSTGAGLDPIYILSPSSTERRMSVIGGYASGFLYCTARVGITGARNNQMAGLKEFIERVRKHVHVPLALGFGISSAEHVREVSNLVEVSVVGSRVIDLYNAGRNEKDSLNKVGDFIKSLRP